MPKEMIKKSIKDLIETGDIYKIEFNRPDDSWGFLLALNMDSVNWLQATLEQYGYFNFRITRQEVLNIKLWQ